MNLGVRVKSIQSQFRSQSEFRPQRVNSGLRVKKDRDGVVLAVRFRFEDN